jgi:hypothetical protein
MLETLSNLKNNKTKQATARQAQGNTAEHLKKFLAGLGKRRHCGLYQLFSLYVKLTPTSSDAARSTTSEFGRLALSGNERQMVARRRSMERRPTCGCAGELEACIDKTKLR